MLNAAAFEAAAAQGERERIETCPAAVDAAALPTAAQP